MYIIKLNINKNKNKNKQKLKNAVDILIYNV
jgi:hypothetical protein